MSVSYPVIYIVRHGEAAAGWGCDPDPGLSNVGHEQAQRVAAELVSTAGDALTVISSPMLRARETAQPLAARWRVRPRIDPTFRELPAPVSLEQRSDWLRAFMTQSWTDQSDAIQQWRHSVIERLCAVQSDAVIFTHYVVLNAVIAHITGNPKTHCYRPANGSITAIQLQQRSFFLLSRGEQRPSVVN